MAGDRTQQQWLSPAEARLLLAYLGRAAPVVPATLSEAQALQPVLQALAGVAGGRLACRFAPNDGGNSGAGEAIG